MLPAPPEVLAQVPVRGLPVLRLLVARQRRRGCARPAQPAGVDEVQRVVEHELALLQPDVRRDAARVLALLHPDFVEHGSSGRVWDRSSVTTAIGGADEDIRATDVQGRLVGPDAVLVTYRSRAAGREALRSSTWVRERGEWLLLFHQGTPVPDA